MDKKYFENEYMSDQDKKDAEKLMAKLLERETDLDEEKILILKDRVMKSVMDDSLKFYIKKKDGRRERYDADKIVTAISKSAERTDEPLSDCDVGKIISIVEKKMAKNASHEIPVQKMHDYVIYALEQVRKDVAEKYKGYHELRKFWAGMLEDIYGKVNTLLFLGDRDNANADSKLASTITCLTAGYLGTSLFETNQLDPEMREAAADGYTYIHDKDKRYFYALNCCLFNAAEVLKGGFEMANVWYNEPQRLDTAFDVIGDITLMAASQQYGGFTIPEVDKLLSPYAEKSFQKKVSKYVEMGIERQKAEEVAYEDVKEEMYQGFQGWEYKFNTVASSRGDYPFITITTGLATDRWGKLASIACLDVRRIGQGKKGHKKPVLFPKIVFLYDENLHGKGKQLEDVFEAGIKCSTKSMYPDWLSLTGEGYICDIYKKYGKVISPMGCRAFLSPYYEKGGFEPADETDEPVYVGRFNIGAISLNLPMIYEKARREGKDFFEELEYYMQLIRRHHCRTYDYIGEMPASRAPLHFCEGGLYGGHLKYNEKIKPCLKAATASFGITALNELQRLYNGKSIADDGMFALEVLEFINKKISEWKKEDGHLYAIYGTPAEKLCGKQVEQFRKKYGVIENVSDREYVSNSFHCHVTEDITPIQKQDLEKRYWELCNGGKIQYVRYPVDYNIDAFRTLVRRAMDMGFYEGVNRSLCFCDDCGYSVSEDSELGDTCPVCGSTNLTKIDRMNGYLAYSRTKGGDTRLNKAKMAEIKDRVSM